MKIHRTTKTLLVHSGKHNNDDFLELKYFSRDFTITSNLVKPAIFIHAKLLSSLNLSYPIKSYYYSIIFTRNYLQTQINKSKRV